MYVIIPVSLGTIYGKNDKAFYPINGKPLIRYILDELYSYHGLIDRIFISGNVDMSKYPILSGYDEFFQKKIECINKSNNLVDDLYYALSEIRCDKGSEVLIWRGDIFCQNSKIVTDLSLGSVIYNKKIIRLNCYRDVWRSLCIVKENAEYDMEKFISKYREYDKVTEIDALDIREWETRIELDKLEASLKNEDTSGKYIISIDYDKRLITKTNKYVDVPYESSVLEPMRRIEYDLWSEGNFLDSAIPEQRIFLPEKIEQGINHRGEYCDWITEEYISGNSLDTLMLSSMDKDEWQKIMNSIQIILSDVFHVDEPEENMELYDSYVPRDRQIEYIDDYYKRLLGIVDSLAIEYSVCNESVEGYSLNDSKRAELLMFIDMFHDMYAKRINKDSLIYNFTCGRLVHNNLTFDNILYNGDDIRFISPRSRQWDIVDKNRDYASLYVSSYCYLNALLNGYYTVNNGQITIQETIYRNGKSCVSALDELLGDGYFYRVYAVIILLEKCADSIEYNDVQRRIMLDYVIQETRVLRSGV